MENKHEYYFRISLDGATVFILNRETRHKRIELQEIATIFMPQAKVTPISGRSLSSEEERAIENWISERKKYLYEQDTATAKRVVEDINKLTHWARYQATPEQLNPVNDDLLLAIYDLRSVLVKKMAEQLMALDEE